MTRDNKGFMLVMVVALVCCRADAAGVDGGAGSPAARRASDFTAEFIAAHKKGYVARPCGFDTNRNGILGEAADRLLGDGKTRDPDGDGVQEDIWYVDSESGSDETGDGSAAKPLRTIQKALEAAEGVFQIHVRSVVEAQVDYIPAVERQGCVFSDVVRSCPLYSRLR